jgi:hypothetical protein
MSALLVYGEYMKNYEATVRVASNYIVVRVQAQGFIQAKWQLEALYGAGSIVHLPREI